MRGLAAFLCLLLTGITHAQIAATPAQDVMLSASIVSGAEHTSSVRLSLRNTGTRPVTILTGMMTGSTPHPAAAFRFFLKVPNQHQVELVCTNSSCGQLGIIAGSVSPYIVTLAPNQAFNIEIPLADFRTIADDQRLCMPETAGARLIVTLHGQQSSMTLLGQGSHGSVFDSAVKDPHWTGTVSESIPLSCQSS